MAGDASSGFDLPPYARSLGMFVERMEDGVPLIACEANELVLGRPGFWHGGVIGGLLETAAYAAVQAALGIERGRLRPATFTVQFLRPAPSVRACAIGTIERAGRRLVSVTASAWQEDRDRHIASSQLTLQLLA